MNLRAVCFLVLGVTLLALTACQRPFTRDRYELVQVGVDDRTDVRQILGKPTSDLGDQWFYDDLDRHYSALIHYDENGKVSGKEWMDSKTGKWEGRNPSANEPPQGNVPERDKKTTRIDED